MLGSSPLTARNDDCLEFGEGKSPSEVPEPSLATLGLAEECLDATIMGEVVV